MSEGIAERYGEFISSLEEKGVPYPSLLVPLVIIAVIGLIGYSVYSNGQQSSATVTNIKPISLKVLDDSGNPVKGAAVTLIVNGKQSDARYTIDDGTVSFKVDPSASLKASVQASGFLSYSGAVSPPYQINLNAAAPQSKVFIVSVTDSNGQPVSGAHATLSFQDGTALIRSSDTSGNADFPLSGNQLSSGATLSVDSQGFETQTTPIAPSDFSQTLTIKLTPKLTPQQQHGDASVRVFDDSGNAAVGIRVSLIDSTTQAAIASASTDSQGLAVFSSIAFGTRFSFSAKDPNKIFQDYSDSTVQEFTANSPVFQIHLAKASSQNTAAITFTVQDEAGSAVSDAVVELFEDGTSKQVDKGSSDSNGVVSFTPTSTVKYYATAWKDGFLPAFVEPFSGASAKTVVLKLQTQGNVQDFQVTVTSNSQPAGNAEVSLFRENGYFLGIPQQQADADGVARFKIPVSFNGQAYSVYATASLPPKEGRSDAVQVIQGAEAFVSLQGSPAALTLTANDYSTGRTIPSTSFAILSNGQVITQCSTSGTNSNCMVQVPSEIPVRVVANAQGYLQTTGTEFSLVEAQKSAKTLFLYPLTLSSQASASLIGVFDSTGKEVKQVQEFDSYTLKFLVNSPLGADRTGFFLRVGDQQSAQSDSAFISNIVSDSVNVIEGSTFQGNCSDPLLAANSGEQAKWVEAILPKASGAREVDVEISTRQLLDQQKSLSLAFRVFGVKGQAPFLFPKDDSFITQLLQQNASSNNSDYCGAAEAKQQFPFSTQKLVCENSLCTSISLTSNGEQATEIPLGGEFTANIQLLGLEDGVDSVTVQSDYAAFLSFASMTQSSRVSFDSQNNVIPVSSGIGERKSVAVTLKALKPSSFAFLTIKALTKGGKEIGVKKEFQVFGTNTFKLTLAPLTMEAGLKEKAVALLTDSFSNPVTDASITYYECDSSPFNGKETNVLGDGSRDNGEDGRYSTELNPTSIGIIGVRISKDGFKTLDQCMITVNGGDFLSADPQTITVQGDSSVNEPGKQIITLNNLLGLKARVSSSVSCTDPQSGRSIPTPLVVFPQSLIVENSQQVEVTARPNVTSQTTCIISFTGIINSRNTLADPVKVIAKVNVNGPVPVPPSCSAPMQCLGVSDGNARSCTPIVGQCGANLQCFSCQTGGSTLPSSIDLHVSNWDPLDIKSIPINLAAKPEDCRVEGFQTNPLLNRQQYANFGFNNGIDPSSLGYPWNYQPNSYNPSFGFSAQNYPLSQNYFPQQYGSYYGQQPYNLQSNYQQYYSGQYQNPYATQVPFGLPPQCQYPQVCQNPQGCSLVQGFSTDTSSQIPCGGIAGTQCQTGLTCDYRFGNSGFCTPVSNYGSIQGLFSSFPQLPPQCSYPSVCSSPSSCSFIYQGGAFNPYSPLTQNYGLNNRYYPQGGYYSQSQIPLKVTLEGCTANEIQVSAEYTGADHFNNFGLGGRQVGRLFIKLGQGDIRQIPINVVVDAAGASYQGPLPSNLPLPQFTPPYYPLPFQQIAQPCGIPSDRLFCPYGTACQLTPGADNVAHGKCVGNGNGQADQYGIPDSLTIKLNRYNGEGTVEYPIQFKVLPQNTQLQFKTSNFDDSSVHVKTQAIINGKILLTIKSTNIQNFQSSQGKLTVLIPSALSAYPQGSKDIALNVVPDDSDIPQYIQLMVGEDGKDGTTDAPAAYPYSNTGQGTNTTVLSDKTCLWNGQMSKKVKITCIDKEIDVTSDYSNAPLKVQNGDLVIRDLGDYQVRHIAVGVTNKPADLFINLGDNYKQQTYPTTVAFENPPLKAPECSTKISDQSTCKSKNCIKIECSQKGITATGDYRNQDINSLENEKGAVTISFDDSVRKDNYPPILVAATNLHMKGVQDAQKTLQSGGALPKGTPVPTPSTPFVLPITPGTILTPGTYVSVHYSFPQGDVQLYRSIAIYNTNPSQTDSQGSYPNPLRKIDNQKSLPATDYPNILQQNGSITWHVPGINPQWTLLWRQLSDTPEQRKPSVLSPAYYFQIYTRMPEGTSPMLGRIQCIRLRVDKDGNIQPYNQNQDDCAQGNPLNVNAYANKPQGPPSLQAPDLDALKKLLEMLKDRESKPKTPKKTHSKPSKVSISAPSGIGPAPTGNGVPTAVITGAATSPLEKLEFAENTVQIPVSIDWDEPIPEYDVWKAQVVFDPFSSCNKNPLDAGLAKLPKGTKHYRGTISVNLNSCSNSERIYGKFVDPESGEYIEGTRTKEVSLNPASTQTPNLLPSQQEAVLYGPIYGASPKFLSDSPTPNSARFTNGYWVFFSGVPNDKVVLYIHPPYEQGEIYERTGLNTQQKAYSSIKVTAFKDSIDILLKSGPILENGKYKIDLILTSKTDVDIGPQGSDVMHTCAHKYGEGWESQHLVIMGDCIQVNKFIWVKVTNTDASGVLFDIYQYGLPQKNVHAAKGKISEQNIFYEKTIYTSIDESAINGFLGSIRVGPQSPQVTPQVSNNGPGS